LQVVSNASCSNKYDAKRKRKWLPEWKKTFPFAEFDVETGMMFCKSCRAFPRLAKGNNLFVGVGGGKIRLKHSKNTAKRHHILTAQGLRLRK